MLKQLGPACNTAPPACEDRFGPTWAPNGNSIALTREWGPIENDQIKFSELFLMNRNGGGLHRLTHLTTATPFGSTVYGSMWSPDGNRLVFELRNSALGTPAKGRALFVISADGSGQRQLTPWTLNAGGDRPDWSADGKLILFRVAGAKEHGTIYTIHPDGSGLKQLTHYPSPKTVLSSSFSPDGKSRSRGSREKSAYPAIFLMRANGTGVRRLTKSDLKFSPGFRVSNAWGFPTSGERVPVRDPVAASRLAGVEGRLNFRSTA